MKSPTDERTAAGVLDGAEAWKRLAVALVIGSIGGIGMWSVVVVLPHVQEEFGVARADASLPYTLTMIGFGLGSAFMGRVADRFGVATASAIGAVALGIGYVAAGLAPGLWTFALAQGVLIGFFGVSSSFVPLVSDISQWFLRRRGIAVALAASGSYIAGALWPPVLQQVIEAVGWRQAHVGVGLFCVAAMLPLSLYLRRPPPAQIAERAGETEARRGGLSPRLLQNLLFLAGLACCVAMAMPQVHIVAYCGDLGYGPARGTEMLALMLGLGVVSRIASGFLADRIGGLRTVLVGSALQGLSLTLYVFFDGLASLYLISALFGLVQGGIVPSYAVAIRELFPAREAGARVGVVIMATILGMALGGWMSGAIFDLTGSYRAAFVNSALWNMLNLMIVLWLLYRTAGDAEGAPVPAAGRG